MSGDESQSIVPTRTQTHNAYPRLDVILMPLETYRIRFQSPYILYGMYWYLEATLKGIHFDYFIRRETKAGKTMISILVTSDVIVARFFESKCFLRILMQARGDSSPAFFLHAFLLSLPSQT
jgi:hypothetical protein